ncbi:trehalose-phosphatase [Rhodobacteraceae bacterium ASV31]|nr:trehalose-phosphatase [Anianabacter salinae]
MIGFSAPDLGDTLTDLPTPKLSESALLFDFDGTLVDIADTPDSVEIAKGLPEMLDRLMIATGGAVALVSGRSVQKLRSYLPDFAGHVIGSHGAQRQSDGTLTEHPMAGTEAVDHLADMVAQFADSVPGLHAEKKPTGATLHYRKAPEAHSQVLKFMQALEGVWPDFEMHPVKMAYEMRPKGIGKDLAIEELMTEPPFSGRVPVFFGDDSTDEPALAMIAQRGGISIKVGEGETAAQYRVPTPASVIDILGKWSGAR